MKGKWKGHPPEPALYTLPEMDDRYQRNLQYAQEMQLQRELARQAFKSQQELRLTHLLGSTGTAFGGITKGMLHSKPGAVVMQEVKSGAMPLHMQLVRWTTLGLLIGLTLAVIGLLIL